MVINGLNFLIVLLLCHNSLSNVATSYFNGFQEPYEPILRTYKEGISNIAGNVHFLKPIPDGLNNIKESPRIEMNLPQYSFNYHVHDNVTGDIKHHMEKRLGDNTSGYYTVLDADGFKRTVTYTADNENGFKAIVHRKPLLHNDAVPTAINTYHNIASGMQFDSLYSTPPANAIILAGTTTGTTAVPTYATDVAVLPVYQMPSLMTDVNTKYRYQTIDLPQQQPPTLQFSTENYQENEQQQVQQSPSPQNQQEQQQQQQQQQQHQDQQQHQHQHQHQHLQQLQPYPGDQQFLLPYPQQPLQQQSQQQHQQQLQQTDADDDSEIVEARFQTKTK